MVRASLSCCGAAEARYITYSVLIAGPKAGGASHGKKRPNYGTREFGNRKTDAAQKIESAYKGILPLLGGEKG